MATSIQKVINEWAQTYAPLGAKKRLLELQAYQAALHREHTSLFGDDLAKIVRAAQHVCAVNRGAAALVAQQTEQRRMAWLRSFYAFAQTRGLYLLNPFAQHTAHNNRPQQAIHAQPGLLQLRDAAVQAIAMLGVTNSRIAGVLTRDVSVGERVRVWNLSLTLEGGNALRAYIDARWPDGKPQDETSFWYRATCPGYQACTRQYEPLSADRVSRIVRKADAGGEIVEPEEVSLAPASPPRQSIVDEIAAAKQVFLPVLESLMKEQTGYMSVGEIAALLRVPPEHVNDWCRQSLIPAPYALYLQPDGWRIHPDGVVVLLARMSRNQQQKQSA